MRYTAALRASAALAVVGLAAGALAVRAYQGPRLWATYEVSGAKRSPAGVSLAFSFTLRNQGTADVAVDRIELADLAGGETSFARFDGGTLAAGGDLTRSGTATVAPSVFDSWTSGRPATLFVYSRNAQGDLFRSRVAASRGAAGP